MNRISLALTVAVAFLSITSCKKNAEADDIALAQKCLDETPVGDYDQAYTCLNYVKDYDSQQANILKCGIVMTSGGLMEDKIVKAYNALKGTQTNSTAAFMTILALDYPNPSGGYDKAKEGDVYCQASGVSGLQYISGIIVAGSYMNMTIASLSGGDPTQPGSGIDISDPTAIDTAVTDLLTACSASPPTDSACTTDLTTLGQTATTLSGLYCSQPDADQDVCTKVKGAVDSAGGDNTAVGQALFCYLNNKTYNSMTGMCQ